MDKERFDFLQDKTLHYVLLSVVHNTNMLPELTEDQREAVLNNVFNIMLNSLRPDAAIIWNEKILQLSEKVKSSSDIEDIMNTIRKDFKEGFE